MLQENYNSTIIKSIINTTIYVITNIKAKNLKAKSFEL